MRSRPVPVIQCLLAFALVASGLNLFSSSLRADPPYPPNLSQTELRITNRRFVSHILFESIENRNAITFLLSHPPNYNAYKDIPHSLVFFCGLPAQCLHLSQRIDRHLRSGYNLVLTLHGSQIDRIEFLKPPNR